MRTPDASVQGEMYEGVQVVRFPLLFRARNLTTFMFHIQCAWWLLIHRREADIIHFEYMPRRWMLLFLVARWLKKSIFLTMTLLGSDDLETLKQQGTSAVRFSMWRHVTGIVAISEVLRTVSAPYMPNPKMIKAIPRSIDHQIFRPVSSAEEKSAIRQRMGLPDHAFVVLFSGAAVYRKGLDLLVEAWPRILQKFPQAILYIAGPRTHGAGYSKTHVEFAQQIDEQINKLGVGSSIIFGGNNPDLVPELLRAADVFTLPSRREGMSNAVIEAMATGLPCVLCRFPWVPEDLYIHNQNLLIAEPQPEKLADAIVTLRTDSALAARLGTQARAFAERVFDPTRLTEELIEMYQHTVQK
jgi:glycosyltransferase involved in cell wall biosynthesis